MVNEWTVSSLYALVLYTSIYIKAVKEVTTTGCQTATDYHYIYIYTGVRMRNEPYHKYRNMCFRAVNIHLNIVILKKKATFQEFYPKKNSEERNKYTCMYKSIFIS